MRKGGRRFSWHEKELEKDGVKREEIERRWKKRESLKKGSDRKGAARKVSGYWRHREEDLLEGIANGTVAAISIAAAEDESGEDTFAIHCGNVINNGKPEMPPSFLSLIQNPACVLLNVGQHEDLDAVISSFFKTEIIGIKYIDAQDFFLKAWGENWNGKDKTGKYRSTNGVLNIIEHANPGYTMLKQPHITNSNWLAPRWTLEQIRYVLEDTEFLSQEVQR